jgi:uncharacterized protein
MKFGLSAEQFHFITSVVAAPLTKLGAVVWCYGSRARGQHAPFSDLDLMVEAARDLSAEIGQIREILQNSDFPFKVDLVRLEDFPKSYRKGFEDDKVKWC